MLNQGRNRKWRGRGLLPSPSPPLFSPGISYFTNHPKNRQRRRLLGIRFVPCLFRSSLSPGRLLWGGGFWAEERLILQANKREESEAKSNFALQWKMLKLEQNLRAVSRSPSRKCILYSFKFCWFSYIVNEEANESEYILKTQRHSSGLTCQVPFLKFWQLFSCCPRKKFPLLKKKKTTINPLFDPQPRFFFSLLQTALAMTVPIAHVSGTCLTSMPLQLNSKSTKTD